MAGDGGGRQWKYIPVTLATRHITHRQPPAHPRRTILKSAYTGREQQIKDSPRSLPLTHFEAAPLYGE